MRVKYLMACFKDYVFAEILHVQVSKDIKIIYYFHFPLTHYFNNFYTYLARQISHKGFNQKKRN